MRASKSRRRPRTQKGSKRGGRSLKRSNVRGNSSTTVVIGGNAYSSRGAKGVSKSTKSKSGKRKARRAVKRSRNTGIPTKAGLYVNHSLGLVAKVVPLSSSIRSNKSAQKAKQNRSTTIADRRWIKPLEKDGFRPSSYKPEYVNRAAREKFPLNTRLKRNRPRVAYNKFSGIPHYIPSSGSGSTDRPQAYANRHSYTETPIARRGNLRGPLRHPSVVNGPPNRSFAEFASDMVGHAERLNTRENRQMLGDAARSVQAITRGVFDEETNYPLLIGS